VHRKIIAAKKKRDNMVFQILLSAIEAKETASLSRVPPLSFFDMGKISFYP